MDIITNEWLEVGKDSIPIDREMVVRTSKYQKYVAKWNGFYWVDANTNTAGVLKGKIITHFYVFDRNPEDLKPQKPRRVSKNVKVHSYRLYGTNSKKNNKFWQ